MLVEDGEPTTYFEDAISDDDVRIHEAKRATAEAQQKWECMCYLIALTIWKDKWQHKRVAVAVKSDNMSALALAARLKIASSSNLIGREVALLYTHATFEPRLIEHIPGIANVLADDLSRIHEPHANKAVPEALKHLVATRVPPRDESFL